MKIGVFRESRKRGMKGEVKRREMWWDFEQGLKGKDGGENEGKRVGERGEKL